MKRILIIGSSGSGKTFLARILGRLLDLPVYHLDAYYWKAGWQTAQPEEWEQILNKLLSQDEWILDGNYGHTLEKRIFFCDSIIYLKLPRLICLRNCLLRFWQNKGRTRSDMAPGCPEKFDLEFCRWIWNFPRDIIPAIEEIIGNWRGRVEIFECSNQRQISALIDNLRSNKESIKGESDAYL